ncbi:hypothetical protein DSL92_05620 [Billgrantia gudaonensis]|uniref:DUF4365 domain-containing protein n=1 Tax=Billgrantia gudaonensis TaxID=376427 RepID=A0A432JIW0_9GAMM|nr:hypothetical protein DSL92_05620 [Halomonas gudaonensis]
MSSRDEVIHASLTVGNAPAVDIVAAKADGSRSLSIQVKTSRGACRRRRYGARRLRVGRGRQGLSASTTTLWYALVDLQKRSGQPPRVSSMPSFWVSEFVLPSLQPQGVLPPAGTTGN